MQFLIPFVVQRASLGPRSLLITGTENDMRSAYLKQWTKSVDVLGAQVIGERA